MKVRIRSMKPQDKGFILSSFRNVLTQASDLPPPQAWEGVERLIERILAHPRTRVEVAVDEGDDTEILGYVCTTNDILHCVVVKRDWRRTGLARALLAPHPALRAYVPHKALGYLARCTSLVLQPLALLEL